jgi:uncharacterized protein YeaO (DUF488 family)
MADISMRNTLKAGNVKLSAQPLEDGTRILIDRLWPRGVKKADAAIDQWVKDIAPSTALRKGFGHDPVRWQEFRRRYAEEIRAHPEQLDRLRALARHSNSCSSLERGRTSHTAPTRPSIRSA